MTKAYDGERNFELLFGIWVVPNIKQRTNAMKGKNRKKAAEEFDASIYHDRGLIDLVLKKHHQLLLQIQI